MRRALIILITASVALVAAAAVFAGDPTKEQIARTPAGDAEATTLVLKKGELPSGWSGGSIKPDLSSSLGCANYKPKQSDLVVIGAAETRWSWGPSSLFSETHVLRTPKMVKLDWNRTVVDPRVLPCLREGFVKHAQKGEKLISLRWISVPTLGPYTKAYRVLLSENGVKVAVDALLFGAKRDEVSLIVSGLAGDEPTLHKLQLRLAHRLANRLHG